MLILTPTVGVPNWLPEDFMEEKFVREYANTKFGTTSSELGHPGPCHANLGLATH